MVLVYDRKKLKESKEQKEEDDQHYSDDESDDKEKSLLSGFMFWKLKGDTYRDKWIKRREDGDNFDYYLYFGTIT